MTVAVTVAANRLSSHAILMTDEPPISLYDQILKELFDELEASETFPPQYVDQLKRLARSNHLHRTESVTDALRESPE